MELGALATKTKVSVALKWHMSPRHDYESLRPGCRVASSCACRRISTAHVYRYGKTMGREGDRRPSSLSSCRRLYGARAERVVAASLLLCLAEDEWV